MSAIFGIFRHDSTSVTKDHLQLMAEPIRERGPDGTGMHVEGPIGLGFVRLQTGTEMEPVQIDDSGPLIITADARIDNRDELLAELHLAKKSSDSEIIENAHQKWGAETAQHFLGTFGYAVWDRSQKIMTIVRDQMGVRPIYITQTKSFTAFATDTSSLLALPEVSKDINETGIFALFFGNLLFEDKEITCYSAIKRLPPAHVLELSPHGEVRRSIYWSLDPEKELTFATDDEYVEAFHERFVTAVKRCLPPSGDVGSTLSGGLDSSSIATVAGRLLQKKGQGPLHTYSGVFPSSPKADESIFSKAVSRQERMIPHEFTPGESSPLESVTPLMQDLAQPFFAPNLFLGIEACKASRSDGLRVLLDGLDGDTTVGHGYDLFLELANAHQWSSFAQETKAFVSQYGINSLSQAPVIVDRFALPELKRMAARGQWLPLLKGVNHLGRELGLSRKNLLKTAWSERNGKEDIFPDLTQLAPTFVDRVNGAKILSNLNAKHKGNPPHRRESHYRGLISGGLPLGMETLDRIAANYQIEYRFPFCDRELVEFCLAIPANQQLKNGWARWVLRQAMSPLLPKSVCWRGDKSDLSTVYQRGLRKYDTPNLNQLTENVPDYLEYYLGKGVPRKVFNQFLNKSTAKDCSFLWKISILNSWLIKREKNLF